MTDQSVMRIGGISGLLFVISFMPCYLSAPDTLSVAANNQPLLEYFSTNQSEILTYNGLLLIISAFFFLWFVGVLQGMLQGGAREGDGLRLVALMGGLVFIALVLAGAAVEIVHPATQARFPNFQPDAQLGLASLALSGWMYRFAFVGMAAMIAANSLMALTTDVLPKWFAWAGFVCAAVALLRIFGPLVGWLTMLWIVVASVLMLAGIAGRSAAAARR